MPATRDNDVAVARIAAMIGEPARARMLMSLLDGSTRTGAELAIIANVSPSTASVHLRGLDAARLVQVRRVGRNRYYGLASPQVARVLKDLNDFAEGSADGATAREANVAGDSGNVRIGRRCYDHLGGELGIALHDGCVAAGWLARSRRRHDPSYEFTPVGISGFEVLGIDVLAMRGLRRRFAYRCPDWREGAYHLGGALGAALARTALERGWVTQQGSHRRVKLTESGRRQLLDALAASGY